MVAFDNTDLRVLQLANNFLDFSHIDPTNFERESPFQNLFKLEKLYLRNNSIKNFLNDWNIVNIALTELDLSYNQIQMIDFGIMLNIWMENITINLTQNAITTMSASKGFINFNESRSTWILNENPLNCDCLIVHFASYLRNKQTSIQSMNLITDNLKCSTPKHFTGISVAEVPLDGLICPLDKDDIKSHKKCPIGCNCYVRTVDSTAIFNCSNANLTKLPTLPNIRSLGLQSYEIHIENNNISALPLANETGYQSVNRIFAKNNSIAHLNANNLPNNLFVLDLSENQLKHLDGSVLTKLNHMQTLQNVSLSGTHWVCDCTAYEFMKFIKANPMRLIDANQIICNHDPNTNLLNAGNLCPIEHLTKIFLSIAVFMALIGLFGMLFYHKYELEIMVWMFAHCKFSWFFTKQTSDDSKEYDAFILYSINDEKFVEDELIPELKNGGKPLKLRSLSDSLGGTFIPDEVSK